MKGFDTMQNENDIQQKMLCLNRKGSMMEVDIGDDTIMRTMVDSFIVTRVEGKAFWLLWKALGYNEGQQYTHTIKVVEFAVKMAITTPHDGEQWVILDMVDDKGRKHHVEMIEPIQDPDSQKAWKRWIKFKNDNKERLARADKAILEEHIKIANEWSLNPYGKSLL